MIRLKKAGKHQHLHFIDNGFKAAALFLGLSSIHWGAKVLDQLHKMILHLYFIKKLSLFSKLNFVIE